MKATLNIFKMHMDKRLMKLLWIVPCFVVSAGYSQQDFPLSSIPLSSPTAAALGKYADIPVSYHTGTPNVAIDLYTIQEGPLTVPISLSYHASGLKVMEQASWVGAGWSLNINGVITRSCVRGAPDEEVSTSGSSHPVGYLHDHGYYSYLYKDGAPTELDYSSFSQGYKDGEADLFFFNFNGNTGTFYFREDNSVVISPQQDIQITPLIDMSQNMDKLYGWMAVTPSGEKYFFGKTPGDPNDTDALEHTHPYSFMQGGGSSISKQASSWYLYRIESADGRFGIDYHYTPEEYGFYTVPMMEVCVPYGGGNSFGLVKNRVYGVRLTSVTFANGSLQLVPKNTPREDLSDILTPNDGDNTSSKALGELRIESSGFCKSFEFMYSYFTNNDELQSNYNYSSALSLNLHTDKKRLKLRAVKENICDNETAKSDYTKTKPPYLFDYYEDVPVPRTLSLGFDHWGFNNGAVMNRTVMPAVSVDPNKQPHAKEGANREPAFPAMLAGALTGITYPTGQHTNIRYNSHQVYGSHETYNESSLDSKSAQGSVPSSQGGGADSHGAWFTFTETTQFRIEAYGFGGGYGTVSFGPEGVGSDTEGTIFTRYFTLPPGTYRLEAQVSGVESYHNGQGVSGAIFQVERNTETGLLAVGGLQVISIIDTDVSGSSPQVTNFDYSSDNGIGQGVLYSRPNYVALIRNDARKASGVATSINGSGQIVASSSDGCISVSQSTDKAYVKSPSSVHPMQTTQGGHIGYNMVKVTQPGRGYTVYEYTPGPLRRAIDISDKIINAKTCDALAPNYPGAPVPTDFTRGELKRLRVFDEQGSLLKDTQYQIDYDLNEEANEGKVGINGLIVKSFGPVILATEYQSKNARKVKSTVLEFTHGQGQGLRRVGTLQETFYESSKHTMPTRMVITEVTGGNDISVNSIVRGRILKENRRTYVGDVNLPCSNAVDCGVTLNLALGAASIAYNSAYYSCADATCQYNAWMDLTQARNTARKQYVDCLLQNNTKIAACIAQDIQQASSDMKVLLNMKKINQIGALVESSTWVAGNFIGSSFITYKDYDMDSYYPTSVETYRTSQPLLATDFHAYISGTPPFSKDSHYKLEESYIYQDGNLVEAVKKDGVPTAYLWGYNNRLPVAKSIGVPFSVLLAAANSVNNDFTALRNHPDLVKAMLSTYQYNPLVGMTFQTDANGTTTSYHYDELGRLSYSKDNRDNVVQKIEYFYRSN